MLFIPAPVFYSDVQWLQVMQQDENRFQKRTFQVIKESGEQDKKKNSVQKKADAKKHHYVEETKTSEKTNEREMARHQFAES